MNGLTKIALGTTLLLATTNVFASLCGTGYINEVVESSENANDLLIKIQYTTYTHPDQDINGYLRFSEDFGVERVDSKRS